MKLIAFLSVRIPDAAYDGRIDLFAWGSKLPVMDNRIHGTPVQTCWIYVTATTESFPQARPLPKSCIFLWCVRAANGGSPHVVRCQRICTSSTARVDYSAQPRYGRTSCHMSLTFCSENQSLPRNTRHVLGHETGTTVVLRQRTCKDKRTASSGTRHLSPIQHPR